jgi:hypothetical protein
MKGVKEIYLQTLWGDSTDNATLEDVQIAISKLKKMDDEHAAFWVGIENGGESILEIHKDLTIIAMFEDDPKKEITKQGIDWKEIENLYRLFLNGELSEVKALLKEGE